MFRAHDPAEGRFVALKIFRLDCTADQTTRLAAALEVLVAEQPRHPAIAAALATGLSGHAVYLAQEFAAGEGLDAYLRHHGPPPVDVTLRILGHVAEALDRAAGEGIHHGTLHPRDVLVDDLGDARLVDLGVAQALGSAGLRAPIRRPYSAPERGEGATWGGPADIFSLGAIAFELVTGRRVIGPGAPDAAASPGVTTLDEPAFADALARALASDPASRFASASDLVDVLRPILARARRPAPVRRRKGTTLDPAAPSLPLDDHDALPAGDLPLTLPVVAPMESPIPQGGPAWTDGTSSRPSRESLVPLAIALMLGLAGGFGLGYWTAWRTAVREAPQVLAGTQVPPPAGATLPPARVEEPTVLGESPVPAPAAAPARPHPRPPAPLPRGRLVVRSAPPGASVRVDGRVRGRTPLVLGDLPLRVVMISIDHKGYKRDERRVALSVARPSVTVEARLTPEAPAVVAAATTGSLVVESRPAGAHVFLDGRDIGVTPLSVPELAPGAHRIRLQLSGFNPWVTMTDVTIGARTRVAASLEQGQP